MKQQKIHKMFLRKNAFLISSDSLKNYNQVKGRNMVAYFNDSTRIEKIDVKGNGESIYFALEGDTSLVGMNKVQCSDMTVRFRGKKVKTITFLKKPDALFIPPTEIQEPERRLKGFRWRISEQPSLATVLSKNDYSGIEIPLILPKTLQFEVPKKEEKPLTRKEKRQQKKQQNLTRKEH